MKPKHIKLPGPFVKAVISTDGSCLICLYPESGVAVSPVGSSEAQSIAGTSGRPKLQLKVYLLGDSLSHLKDVPADLSFPDMTKLDRRVVLFGSQMHLVIHSSESPEDIISLVLGISSMKESIKMKEVGSSNFSRAMETKPGQSCPHLGYIFHIYDKFPTCPPLVDQQRSLELTLLLAQTSVQRTTVACNVAATPSDCKDYVQAFLKKLAKKGKSFENLQITVSSYYLDEFLNSPTPVSRNNDTAELVGAWISKLLSLVPVQIACAENNSLRPLINGLEINSNLTFQDAVSMSNLIQFGFYDLILNSWNGNITVISSMGKQSSGKSYLLNHVTGSLFDVAGGRCTAGLWMTTRIRSDCLYVLLDFEGLGSFERSDQEDMLLSLLSAAMSNVTLFNKKDFHLDKETELLFDRFQSGVDLVKQDSKLFRGLFYIAIKDVDAADTDDLTREFDEKIQQMCSKSNDNFLLKMYNGDVQIETMAPFRSTKYQKSLRRITNTIQHIGASYSSGRSFMRDMKLLIAQICTKDWSPLDDKRAALRVSLLKQHFTSAVRMGCLCTDSGKKSLISLDTEDEIEDSLLQQVGDVNVANLELADTGLELLPFHSITMPGSILQKLKYEFEKIVLRTGEKDEIWFALFEKFLLALVERRKKRVFLWLECNSCDFSEDGDFQKLKSEAKAALAELKEGLTPCSTKCSDCFLKCVLEKGHDQCCHSCKGSHICTSLCSFCVEKERDTAVVEQCTDVSGHGGPHDCKKKNHTCVEDCHFAASSSNCNKSCALKVGHADHHHCNSLQHTCKMVCDALECRNTCIFPLENGDHEKHACHRTFCLSKCSIPSCHRSCAKEDHFHASDPQAKHFCENEHLCQHDCEGKGTCEVLTELVKQTRVYPGKKGSFEYQYQSEQNGLRKGCCIVIPAFRDKHDGMHMHTTNPDAVHYCDKRCPSCGYFCNLEFGHDSVHRTTHGNMRLTRFVAESEDINIEGRMYEWGESGKAEMCMMHCKSRGRGHIHLIPCPVNKSGVCTKMLYGEEARHQTRTYGPDSNICKDEMTHKTYWEHIRFLDPCTKEEQTSFALCDYYCSSEKHKQESRSYCTEKLWHASLQASSKGVHSSTVGFVLDGHQFDCNHEDMYMAFVIIFVIDVSRSMHKSDVTPSNEDLAKRFPSRLGCVFESIDKFLKARAITVDSDRMSVILFAYSASVAVDLKAVDPNNILNEDLYKKSKSNWLWTRYASGLEEAENLLDKLAETKEIQQTERSTDKTKQVNVREAKDSPTQAKKPIIIFLSDGVNRSGNDPIECVEKMKKKYGDLVLHTILFNKKPKNTEEELLKKMAESAGGRYYLSQDQLQLDRSFTGIVQSLRPMTSVAMNRTSRNF